MKNIKETLELHKKWLNAEAGGVRADLSYVNLRGADLKGADLKGADLSYADLRGADLKGANLRDADIDFSSWPLHCGGFDVKVDIRIVAQLAMHFCRLDAADVPGFKEARAALIPLANQFHRDDVDKLEG